MSGISRFRALRPFFAAAAMVMLASSGRAAPTDVFDQIQMELLPVGSVSGDGLTPVNLHVLLMDVDGKPLDGALLKASATSGQLSSPEPVGSGVFRLRYTPPRVVEQKQASVTLRLKTADKRRLRRDWGLTVVPPVGHKMAISGCTETLMASEDASCSVSLQLTGGPEASRDQATLALRTSSGQLDNLTPMGAGRYVARYTPTPSESPSAAVITAVDLRDPTRTYAATIVKIAAQRTVSIKTRPDTKVFVDVGGTPVGPLSADDAGDVEADLLLPPGATSVHVRSISETDETDENIPIELDSFHRIQFMAHYAQLPSDAGKPIPVRFMVTSVDGTPDASTRATLSVSEGSVSEPRHEGNGIYTATVTPPTSNTPNEITVTAVLDEVTQAVQSLSLLPVQPTTLEIQTTPRELNADTTEVTVNTRVVGSQGQTLPDRPVRLQPTGARLTTPLSQQEDGSWQGVLTRRGRGPIDLLGTSLPAASTNTPRNLLVLPMKNRLPPDGLSGTVLNILAADEFGHPVKDISIKLTLLQGDGQLPSTANTGDSGVAQVTYTSGRMSSLINILIEAEGLTTQVGLLQLAPELSETLTIPQSGSDPQLDRNTAWSELVKRHRIDVSGQ